jgi:hypothetical protein
MAAGHHNSVLVWSATGAWEIPTVQGSIPELWRILNRVLEGWRREVVLAKETLAPLNPEASIDLQGFERLRALHWPFVQAFLTYVTFFFMLEGAYQLLYSHLNRLNRDVEAFAVHRKLPKRTPYVERLWHIRNHSIAHFASTERQSPDHSAGAMLDVSTGTKEGRPDLDGIRFGGRSVAGARPRETMSLHDSHVHCVEYLRRMDVVCDEYFGAILTSLPKTVNGRSYLQASGTSSLPVSYFDIT